MAPARTPAPRHAAATVQDFLEHYEVGETVGVGGEALHASACDLLDL